MILNKTNPDVATQNVIIAENKPYCDVVQGNAVPERRFFSARPYVIILDINAVKTVNMNSNMIYHFLLSIKIFAD